jgi:hypothetical protein
MRTTRTTRSTMKGVRLAEGGVAAAGEGGIVELGSSDMVPD